MSLFSYRPNATLYVCNDCLTCHIKRYGRLLEKDMITEDHVRIMKSLNRYRFLTLDLMSHVLGIFTDPLRGELKKLETYGLVLRQYFKYKCENEEYRSPVFYSLSPNLPFEFDACEKKIGCEPWNKDLGMAEVMSSLNFNMFHIILKAYFPHKALQAQTNYKVGGIRVNGRYKLKSKKFFGGYSHCIVFSVMDFAEDNQRISKRIKYVLDYFESRAEKKPWFLLLCESSLQASYLTEKISAEIGNRTEVYYILSSDLDYDENPFHVIQSIRKEDGSIISHSLILEDWYQ